jgi:hypothetical protein
LIIDPAWHAAIAAQSTSQFSFRSTSHQRAARENSNARRLSALRGAWRTSSDRDGHGVAFRVVAPSEVNRNFSRRLLDNAQGHAGNCRAAPCASGNA